LFAGTWGGGVFLSSDNGTNWTGVNDGLTYTSTQPSSIVHALVVSGTNLFAATRGTGVWRRPLSELITSIKDVSIMPHPKFAVGQNYPNPFNLETTFCYQLTEIARVRISVYNKTGQLVRMLMDCVNEPGSHIIRWDRKNNSGDVSPTGIYFVKFETNECTDFKKILSIK
jgi:hypothetical protein